MTLFTASPKSNSTNSLVSNASTISSSTSSIDPSFISSFPQSGLAIPSAQKYQAPLYANLDSETKARVAVNMAFTLSPHQLLNEYTIKRIIGFGSNGTVLAAIQTKTKTQVAIKIIYKQYTNDPSTTAIPSEIASLKLLSPKTPKILKYVTSWSDANHYYLVTELFGSDWLVHTRAETMHPLQTPFHTHKIPFSSGSSDLWAWSYATRAFMHEATAGCGATLIPERAVKRIVVQVAQALKEMHGCGYFHGDVKIENVLVGYRDDCVDDGCGGVEVRLADFGHVRHWMRGMDAYGTREVSPPEFLSGFVGESPVDGRKADVFALGVLMFMLLSDEGQLPSAVRVFRAGGLGYESLLALHHGFYPLDDIGLEPVPMSLLYAMTRVDPDTRYSIDDVLAHPYLADVV